VYHLIPNCFSMFSFFSALILGTTLVMLFFMSTYIKYILFSLVAKYGSRDATVIRMLEIS
jgi:hypothetical protein